MKHWIISLRILFFMTVVLGLTYPLAMTAISQMAFPQQAAGSPLERGGQVIGSALVAQNFEKPPYFWPRPSAVNFNPLPSGGSNLSPASQALKKVVEERRAKLKTSHPNQGEPPQDLLFASGSGLDPEISVAAAEYQAERVALARGMEIDKVNQLIQAHTHGRQWGFLGEPRVHVLRLNLALDASQGTKIDAPPQAGEVK